MTDHIIFQHQSKFEQLLNEWSLTKDHLYEEDQTNDNNSATNNDIDMTFSDFWDQQPTSNGPAIKKFGAD